MHGDMRFFACQHAIFPQHACLKKSHVDMQKISCQNASHHVNMQVTMSTCKSPCQHAAPFPDAYWMGTEVCQLGGYGFQGATFGAFGCSLEDMDSKEQRGWIVQRWKGGIRVLQIQRPKRGGQGSRMSPMGGSEELGWRSGRA